MSDVLLMAKQIQLNQTVQFQHKYMVVTDLVDSEQWNKIIQDSFVALKGIAVFKHSDTCSISQMAYSRIQRNWKFNETELPFYLIEVKKNRPISNLISAELNIQHESPQLFLIKNGVCIYNESHGSINVKDLEQLVA
jgi:bacillithiol system protein YtxJ